MRSLAAFEKSEYADDWRDLMRLYMVRRTRSFIQDNYAQADPDERAQIPDLRGRHALLLPGARAQDGQVSTSTMPTPTTSTPGSTAPAVVDAINALTLPRYGLGNYIAPAPHQAADAGGSQADAGPLARRASG